MSKVCGLRFLISYYPDPEKDEVEGRTYSCERPKDHDGRHKQKIAGSDPPATFSWVSDSYTPPVIRMDHDL